MSMLQASLVRLVVHLQVVVVVKAVWGIFFTPQKSEAWLFNFELILYDNYIILLKDVGPRK